MRIPGLDLLRAIAIAWVMLFHSFLVGGLGEQWDWLSRYGWMGVDLFFVLSGFLIGHQVLAPLARGETFSFRDFYLRRAFRILPAFWVVLAVYLLVPAFAEAPAMEPAWKFLAFIVNLDIDYANNAAFSNAWSLCVEEHFYLVFPVLAWAMVRRSSPRGVLALCVGLVLAGIAVRSAVWLHDTATAPARNWFVEDIYYPTWCRLDGLLAGVVLAVVRVFRPGLWEWLSQRANAVLAAGVLVMALALWLFRERTGLLGNSIGWPVLSTGLALLVCAAAQRHGAIGRWRVPGMAWLAAISYSLYLVHKPVFHLVGTYWGEAIAGRGLLTFVVYAAASLGAGALLHYLVERPGLALRGRLLSRRRLVAEAAPAA
ncbi:acyltransferase family protein [Agrilutibacter solisilvae]|uniref:Acyltransferase n=1 Tax=Agrilutibacter solisilvae TaxID=2763317 RepID=A0A975ASQ8_9GAMM|nr:acyltransferase [Lysobacter solisilvae]QSX79027.1 acyltransferase [Lysobacter solisilvae]